MAVIKGSAVMPKLAITCKTQLISNSVGTDIPSGISSRSYTRLSQSSSIRCCGSVMAITH
jgi:hypothetical protein